MTEPLVVCEKAGECNAYNPCQHIEKHKYGTGCIGGECTALEDVGLPPYCKCIPTGEEPK